MALPKPRRLHTSEQKTASSLSPRPPGEPGNPGQGDGGFPIYRRADLRMTGNCPAKGSNDRIAK